jgi:hypothetical protein
MTNRVVFRVAALIACLIATTFVAPAASAVALPGGKANWVAAIGGLQSGSAHTNWVRLGYYQFSTDGSVVHNWWNWYQPDQPPRVGTGVDFECSTTTDVPAECEVLTASGFTGAPMGGFEGTFGVSGTTLTVSWTHDRDGNPLSKTLVETWDMAAVDTELHRADGGPTGFSNYSATHGFAYGSNYSFGYSSRASMAELAGEYGSTVYGFNSWFWNRDQVANVPSALGPLGGWQPCDNGLCLGRAQQSSACNCTSSTDVFFYLAEHDGGRRNSIWMWCECLALDRGETCYTGNSHIRPLLQVVDDGGDFRGWVGVEPFSNSSSPGDFYNEYWVIFELTDAV